MALKSVKTNKPHKKSPKKGAKGNSGKGKKASKNGKKSPQKSPMAATPRTPTAALSSARKSVSFAAKLEHSRLLEEMTGATSVNTPEISPSRSILKRKAAIAMAEQKENRAPETPVTSAPKSALNKKSLHKAAAGKVTKTKVKKELTVKKSIKEKLLKMSKPERRAFLRELKIKHKPIAELAYEAKLLWERVRSSKCPAEERETCIAKLMSLVDGKCKQLIYSHDSSRVIQCLMMLKREEIQSKLFEELLPEIVRMTKSKYAKFFVQKMLKHGTNYERGVIMRAFNGHCSSMYRIVCAAGVVELAYNDFANAEQRNRIISEFYGNEFVLFWNQLGQIPSLQNIADKAPAKIAPIMKNLEEVLQNVVAKVTLKHSLTHKLLLDFLTYCSPEQRSNMIDSLKDRVPEISHTREGSRVGMICVWHANPKERKAIVKSFKGLALKSAQDEFSRRVLFAIFDSVDDTVAVNKYIIEELANNVADLTYSKFGVWALHYLVHPRHYSVFHKGIIEMLKEGDGNAHSKKSPSERYKQLFDCVKKPLFTFMAANMKEILTNKISAVLVLDALEPNDPLAPLQRDIDAENKEACFRAIAAVAAEEFVPHAMDGGEPHIIQGGCARFVLMKLLKADRNQSDVKLSNFFAELPSQHLASFVAINNGCFVLLNMAQSGSQNARAVVQKAISPKALKRSTFAGAVQLLQEFGLSA